LEGDIVLGAAHGDGSRIRRLSATASISSMGRIPAIGSVAKENASATAPTNRPSI